MPKSHILTSVVAVTMAAGAAGAQSQPPVQPRPPAAASTSAPEDAQGAAPAETLICTDRPTKSGNTCTVPAGDVQIEADVFNWSRASLDGVTSATYLFT